MMKKITQTLLLFFSTLLLLVSVTISAQGQPSQTIGFTGVWNVITDKGETYVITLRHDRSDFSVVVGSYHILGDGLDKPLDGGLKGTVKDNVLRFTWSSDENRRAGRLRLSSDGESIEGTFSATRNPDDTSGGTLSGTRVHSFAGAWEGKLGEGALQLILQQTGPQVTGQLRVNSAEFAIREGSVGVGNTLRFKIVRPGRRLVSGGRISPEEYVGSGELVMEKGGKSFKGKILGADASGTLVGR